MRKGKFGWGIVGCGNIGPAHAKGVIGSKTAEIIAFCDPVKGKAEKLAAEYGGNAYGSMKEMLDAEPGIDCVSLCTPSGMHAVDTNLASKYGKHILTEKPLDISLKAMDRMIRTCKKRKVKLACVFQRRTSALHRRIREAVQGGELGKIVLADCYQKWYRGADYYKSGAWRATWELDGGGALMNQCVHGVDLLLWIAGDVERVTAYAAPLVRKIEVEDTAVAILKFKSGAFGVIEGTTSCTPGESTRFEIHGENGTIIFGDQGLKRWAVADTKGGKAKDLDLSKIAKKPKKSGGTGDPKAISAGGHTAHVIDLCQAIKKNREPMVSGESARKAVELNLAIYRSAMEGREIKLPLRGDIDRWLKDWPDAPKKPKRKKRAAKKKVAKKTAKKAVKKTTTAKKAKKSTKRAKR